MTRKVGTARAGRRARRWSAGALAALVAATVSLGGLMPAAADELGGDPSPGAVDGSTDAGAADDTTGTGEMVGETAGPTTGPTTGPATEQSPAADDGTAAERAARPQDVPASGEPALPVQGTAQPTEPSTAVDGDAATVVVHVGGYRTGATTVSGLGGVTLGLFASEGATSPVDGDWGVATSDVGGVVTFTVPADQIGSSTRYWVKGVSGSGGYALDQQLTTAPITDPDNDTARPYAFQTPKLVKGGRYESGKDFMTLPTKGTDYTASEGRWALSYANPTLEQQCGVRVALVVDLSASVLQANATKALHDAAKTYVDALLGTPSEVQLFSFGTTATVESALTPVSTQANVDALDAKIETLTPKNTSYTNWDDALWTVTRQAGTFDLAVVVTDGNPTVYQASQAGKNTRFAEVEAGILSANSLKLEGTRIVALGVGDGVGSADAGVNLAAISGADAYLQTGSYQDAGSWLRDSVFAACTPSLTVVKEVSPVGGGAFEPAGGWTFDATTSSAQVTALADHGTTAAGTGAVNFPVTFADPSAADVAITIAERQQAGYELVQQSGKNATCTVKNKANPTGTALAVTNAGGLGFTLAMSAGDMVSCTVRNSPVPMLGLTATTTATAGFDRDYEWAIDKSVDRREAEVAEGEAAQFEYTVRVTPSGPFDANHRVTGSLVVSNPNAFAVTADLAAVAAAGGVEVGTVELGETAVSVPAGGSATVGYTVDFGDTSPAAPVVVTGTATWGHPAGGASSSASDASEAVAFSTPSVVTDRTATVQDVFDSGTAANLTDDLVTALVTDVEPLDAEAILADGPGYWETTYVRDIGATLAPGETGTYHNVATVTPSHDDPEADDETVTVVVPAVYDLALRIWVSQVHRGDELVHELHSAADEPGPDYDVPYVEVQVGDLLTHDVRLFNQGNRAARVTQVVDYLPAGLELVEGPNEGWSPAANGNLYLDPATPIVLRPGEEVDVNLVLRVTGEADPDAVIENYAEISAFEGLVPVEAAPAVLTTPVTARFAVAGPVVAPLGEWATVDDADSHADDDNSWVLASVTGIKFENNEIGERDTTDDADTDAEDVDNDQDDHDGNFLRLMSLELPTDPTPDSTPIPAAPGGPTAVPGTGDPTPVANVEWRATPGRLASTGATVWTGVGAAVVLLASGALLLVVRRRAGEAGQD